MVEIKKNKKNLFIRLYHFVARIICLFIFITLLQVFAFRFINTPFAMSNLNLRIKNIFSSDQYIIPRGDWRSIEDISPYLVKAVLAAEDQRFMAHSGFDYLELSRAVKDILHGKRVRGASTISMQMARTVFLWQERSVTRKITEAYYTILIESVMPKERIMELYLNTVDWGSGIMGAEAASKRYFNKSASQLTVREAALLAAILKSPHTWSPVNPNEQVLARQQMIIKSMTKMHL